MTITDSHARAMYGDLKDQLGKQKALRVTGLERRGMEEQDLLRCTLPGRIKVGIQLSHEKHVQGINHRKRAKDKYM